MRSVAAALVLSLSLTSCAGGRGPSSTDGYGALAAAVILGAGVAILAHNR
ncbi:MAG TPA: hypothetical protein VEF76_08225 [Patescibacteria group bacterium]|nr:hypothetical protein [Patescibacteria group bacterium]